MAKSVQQFLEEARRLIGQETEIRRGLYPVEYEPIRRYCHMTNDTNPLFLDPSYARNTKYGEVICPPFLVEYFARAGSWPATGRWAPYPLPPTPGDRLINLSREWEFFKPVKVGDRLSSSAKVVDVYIKPIRLDAKAFWILTETIIKNQHGDVVAILRNLVLTHRSPEHVKDESL